MIPQSSPLFGSVIGRCLKSFLTNVSYTMFMLVVEWTVIGFSSINQGKSTIMSPNSLEICLSSSTLTFSFSKGCKKCFQSNGTYILDSSLSLSSSSIRSSAKLSVLILVFGGSSTFGACYFRVSKYQYLMITYKNHHEIRPITMLLLLTTGKPWWLVSESTW